MRKLIIAVVAALAIVGGAGGVLAARTMNGGTSASPSAADAQDQQGPWLGASIVQTPDGPTVSTVIAGSPADKAGLTRGDVIKAIDGTSVSDAAAIRDALKNKNAGDSVTLSITRAGNAQDVAVPLEARPAPLPRANALFPELNGLTPDQIFSHIMGGSFQFTDANGNSHTATVDLGTVTAVDTTANTLTANLNAGGSQTYNITADVHIRPALSAFQKDDHVTIISVDGNVRAITKGKAGGFPFFGGGHGGGHRGRHSHKGGDVPDGGSPSGAAGPGL